MTGQTFLVTGGCGFIGSHLADALAAAGHRVRVLDDLSTGTRAHLPADARLLEADVADPAAAAAALEGVDGCFHLAAVASVERGRREWRATHRTNQSGTVTLLEAIARGPRPIPFVYASSAAVYGDAAALPIVETAAKSPLSAYGVDKLGSEMHAAVAARLHAIPTVGLRFFNVYGPRQDPRSPYSGVVSIFLDRLPRGEPVTLFGDGGQTRDFIHVADVVAVLAAAMSATLAAARAGAIAGAEVFNVCTGTAVSVRALAQTIADLAGRVPELRSAPARDGDIRHSLGSPAALRAAFALPPPRSLREGLAATLAASARG